MKLLRQPYPTSQKSTSTPALNNTYQDIQQVVNGSLTFGSPSQGIDNMQGYWATVTTPATANDEFTVTHNLGRIPTGWILFSIDQPGIVYKGTTSWTPTTMSLKCNTASTNLVLFLT